jgi:hypothetical protein
MFLILLLMNTYYSGGRNDVTTRFDSTLNIVYGTALTLSEVNL